ncbi:MAG: hypothetical protein AMXMBFR20_27830 [Planctomycetia bacterium]|jgi:hypothetical protein|nr:MAG: hypothetical protein B6D36_03390 [Planctomycetes bacterium UTPLA1]
MTPGLSISVATVMLCVGPESSDPAGRPVDLAIDDCLTARKGVCQDFAHVLIAASRGEFLGSAETKLVVHVDVTKM